MGLVGRAASRRQGSNQPESSSIRITPCEIGGSRRPKVELPAFRDRVDAPGWRELTALAP